VSEAEIARLREEIAAVDREIVGLVARRLHLAEAIGLEKRLAGTPLRDAEIEEQVAARIERECAGRGIDPSFGESLGRLLIAESVRRQEGLPMPEAKSTRILVVGGAGAMGRWLARYLRSQGYPVAVHDPAGPLEGFPFEPVLPEAVARSDAIAVSVPIHVADHVLERIAAYRPRGLVFDLCSLKAPIAERLRSMVRGGLKVASVHPLFGPSLWPPSSGTILFCGCGDDVAVQEAKGLFRPGGATLLDIPLDDHDEFMAYLLGLSHLSLLAFARAVASGPFDLATLREPAGTTFARLSSVVLALLQDSPELLRDIQALNPHTRAIHRRLQEALDDWLRATEDPNREAFTALLDHARSYFGGDSP